MRILLQQPSNVVVIKGIVRLTENFIVIASKCRSDDKHPKTM